jgi:hypothetical protein
MYFECKKFESVFDSLLDLKGGRSGKKGFSEKRGNEDEEERFKLS